MTRGLTVLAPLIAACVAIGVSILTVAAWKNRRWPPPSDWRSPYGRLKRKRTSP